MSRFRKIVYWIPALVWMGLIFYMSSRPSIPTNQIYRVDFIIKKTAHFIEYFVLTFLLIFSVSRSFKVPFSRAVFIAFIVAVCYAISDEWHQSFIPGREPRVRDVLIDTAGVIAASVAIIRYRFI